MSDFAISETDQFLTDLERLSLAGRDRTILKLRSFVYPQLRVQPHFGSNIKKLKGYKPDTWRYRIGAYRFFYYIDDEKKTVFMLATSARQKSY